MRVRVKICCITSVEEARIAIEEGADALGLVARMPSGPGPISDDLIASVTQSILPGVSSFLLTCEQSSARIIEHVNKVKTNTVQIVDEVPEGTYAEVRAALPGLKIVQVIHVNNDESIAAAAKLEGVVDGILLDSGNPFLKIKTLGGTGNVHNWRISSRIRTDSKIPIILAGGLNASNVKSAIETVNPYMVDVCSGVRSDGHLDRKKVREFISAVMNV